MAGDFSRYIDIKRVNKMVGNMEGRRVVMIVEDDRDGVRWLSIHSQQGPMLLRLPVARLLRLACDVALEAGH